MGREGTVKRGKVYNYRCGQVDRCGGVNVTLTGDIQVNRQTGGNKVRETETTDTYFSPCYP